MHVKLTLLIRQELYGNDTTYHFLYKYTLDKRKPKQSFMIFDTIFDISPKVQIGSFQKHPQHVIKDA